MRILDSFWIHGFMPVQFLLVLAAIFMVLVLGQFLLKKMGKEIPVFGQGILIWFVTFFVLKFVLHPPIPSSLLYTYMGLVTIVIFLYVSSTEIGWTEFKQPFFTMLQGQTRINKISRGVVFTLVPVFTFFATYQFLNPAIEEPVELRVNHPAPPANITIHGKKYNLQTARNPFRTNGPPLYPDTGIKN